MPRIFTVSYLLKDKDLDFEGGIIKALSKFGYRWIETKNDEKVRVLLFGKKEGKHGPKDLEKSTKSRKAQRLCY